MFELPLQIWLLGGISFFADIASEMLYPIVPIFITTVLGGSHLSIGLIEGVAELCAAYLKVISGRYIDKTGKGKYLIFSGYLLSALSKPFIGVATSWLQVLGARSTDRIGKGLRATPRDVFLTELAPTHLRGKAFGLHRSMDTFGAFVGPIFCLWILENISQDLRQIFIWSVVPGLIAAALCLFIKSPKLNPPTQFKISELFILKSINKELPKKYYHYLSIWGLFCLVNSSDMFILLKAKESLNDFKSTIILYCFYNLVYAIASPYLGSLSDRVKRTYVISFGLIIFSVVYFGIAYAQNFQHFMFLFLIYGLYNAATEGIGKALAADLIPKELRGSGLGLFGTMTSMLMVIASIIAGVLWDHIGAQIPFIVGGIGALVSAFLLLMIPLTPEQK